MSSKELPMPLVPADVDLRGYEFMPLYGDRLMTSETWISASAEAKVAAIHLWWHGYGKEVPAGTLPNNDNLLASYAGFGVAVQQWKRVKGEAMRGWVLCTDGRWHHPFLAELVAEAWKMRQSHTLRTLKARVGAMEKRLREAKTDSDREHISGLLQALKTSLSQALKKSVTDNETDTADGLLHGQTGQDSSTNNLTHTSTLATRSGHPPGVEGEQAQKNGTQRGEMSKLLRELGVPVTPSHPLLVGWIDRGVSTQMAREAVTLARDQKPAPEPIPPKYLDAIIGGLLNPKTRTTSTGPKAGEWWQSDAGWMEKATELGIEIRLGPGFPAMQARVCKRLGPGAWQNERDGTLMRLISELPAEGIAQ